MVDTKNNNKLHSKLPAVMGISTTHIINHDLYFIHTDQWIQQVVYRTGIPVFTEMYYTDRSQVDVVAPVDFDGWVMRSRDGMELQEIFKRGEPLTMQAKGTWLNGFCANINPYVISLSHEKFHVARRNSVKYLADLIYRNGLPGFKHSLHKTDDVFRMLNNRINLFEFSKMFNHGQVKLISFCDDQHLEWQQHFFKSKWSIDDYTNWALKEMTLVKYRELNNFIFPNKTPAINNVIIEDDFIDLNNDEYERVRPYYQVNFAAFTTNISQSANGRSLVDELKIAALQFPLQLTVNTTSNSVYGTIKWLRNFFPQYFAEHFVLSFFKDRKIMVSVGEI